MNDARLSFKRLTSLNRSEGLRRANDVRQLCNRFDSKFPLKLPNRLNQINLW